LLHPAADTLELSQAKNHKNEYQQDKSADQAELASQCPDWPQHPARIEAFGKQGFDRDADLSQALFHIHIQGLKAPDVGNRPLAHLRYPPDDDTEEGDDDCDRHQRSYHQGQPLAEFRLQRLHQRRGKGDNEEREYQRLEHSAPKVERHNCRDHANGDDSQLSAGSLVRARCHEQPLLTASLSRHG